MTGQAVDNRSEKLGLIAENKTTPAEVHVDWSPL